MKTEARIQLDFRQLSLLERLLTHHIHTFVKNEECRICGAYLGVKVAHGAKMTGRHMQDCPIDTAQDLIRLLTEVPSKGTSIVTFSIKNWLKEKLA